MVAQYADGCNLFGDPERARHLLGVLGRHCENVGRDPAEITKTSMMSIAIAETEDGARRKLDALRAAGLPRAADRGHDGRDAGADPRARPRLPRRRDRGPDLLDARRPRPRGGGARGRDARPAPVRPVARDVRRGTRRRLAGARVARLASAAADGTPHVVPCTFALLGDATIVSAVDHKPKRTTALRRLANIAREPAGRAARRPLRRRLGAPSGGRAPTARRGSWRQARSRTPRRRCEPRSPPAMRSTASSRRAGALVVIAVERWSGWSAA